MRRLHYLVGLTVAIVTIVEVAEMVLCHRAVTQTLDDLAITDVTSCRILVAGRDGLRAKHAQSQRGARGAGCRIVVAEQVLGIGCQNAARRQVLQIGCWRETSHIEILFHHRVGILLGFGDNAADADTACYSCDIAVSLMIKTHFPTIAMRFILKTGESTSRIVNLGQCSDGGQCRLWFSIVIVSGSIVGIAV